MTRHLKPEEYHRLAGLTCSSNLIALDKVLTCIRLNGSLKFKAERCAAIAERLTRAAREIKTCL